MGLWSNNVRRSMTGESRMENCNVISGDELTSLLFSIHAFDTDTYPVVFRHDGHVYEAGIYYDYESSDAYLYLIEKLKSGEDRLIHFKDNNRHTRNEIYMMLDEVCGIEGWTDVVQDMSNSYTGMTQVFEWDITELESQTWERYVYETKQRN